MIKTVTSDNIQDIKNARFRKDAGHYIKMYEDFMDNFRGFGLPIAESDYSAERSEILEALVTLGVKVRNHGRSLLWGDKISGACIDCHKGEHTNTFILTLKCNRDCFFCANKNQFDYAEGKTRVNNIIELYEKSRKKTGGLHTVAITGGEPLLYLDKCLEFIRYVKSKVKQTNIRIYTNGDLATEEVLSKLAKAGLDEIRFGLKLDDEEKLQKALSHLSSAVNHIPRAMVEMPVEPDKLDAMKHLADRFEEIRIFGINILEFLFPWVHIDEFKESGYKITKRPYKILYDYTYAGGVPIAESEISALKLLKYIAEKNYSYGAHYCSLENKLTAQIWQHNSRVKLTGMEYLSGKDFFIKMAKAYGEDAAKVREILNRNGVRHYNYNAPDGVISFPIAEISSLKGEDMLIGISSVILDPIGNGKFCLREVAVDMTDTESFSLEDI
ncbi:MAG: radical SAM protein [Deferribacteraceae bacterium]|jgi:pyruvate formate-lyase activating enzyme-like uncharacterized protein|nr:radical SAM protein [Deferribacteraceae bacterium]